MANPWDNTFENGHTNAGAGNGRIAVATKVDSNPVEVYWRFDNGVNEWGAAPVLVGTVGDELLGGGSGAVFHTHYDGIYVWVENGIDTFWRSPHYGAEGSWEVY